MKNLKGKYILAFDTICTGWECVRDENNQPYLYSSKEEAEADIEDEEDFFIPAEEFIENRKAIFTGDGIYFWQALKRLISNQPGKIPSLVGLPIILPISVK